MWNNPIVVAIVGLIELAVVLLFLAPVLWNLWCWLTGRDDKDYAHRPGRYSPDDPGGAYDLE